MAQLKDKRFFLLDMDGTIYIDRTLFPSTLPFLEFVKDIGGRYLFLTNNSSHSVQAYVSRLAKMGIAAQPDDFFTSTSALIEDLKSSGKVPTHQVTGTLQASQPQAGGGESKESHHNMPYQLCYVFGTRAFRAQLQDVGVPVTDRLADDIDCLLIGYDTELTYQKLEDACILLGRGVDFIATNPDWVCPTWYGYAPDCGSVCEMLFRATGRRPRVIGKPRPAMVLLSMEKCGFSADETLVVGDRLYTDIACGQNAGVDTALVLSGESTREDAEMSEFHPTWIFDDIGWLLCALQEVGKTVPAASQ